MTPEDATGLLLKDLKALTNVSCREALITLLMGSSSERLSTAHEHVGACSDCKDRVQVVEIEG